MNSVRLHGYLKNIQPSHTIGDVIYDKADIVVPRNNGKEDIVSLRFKRYANTYSDGDTVSLTGNLRSYSHDDNGHRVPLYVFTYFDCPPDGDEWGDTVDFEIDGHICKIDPLRTTTGGKKNVHFIIANNLIVSNGDKKLNAYLPCIAWGKLAHDMSKLKVGDYLRITGRIHSREYVHREDDGEAEIKVAHELMVTGFSTDEATEGNT